MAQKNLHQILRYKTRNQDGTAGFRPQAIDSPAEADLGDIFCATFLILKRFNVVTANFDGDFRPKI